MYPQTRRAHFMRHPPEGMEEAARMHFNNKNGVSTTPQQRCDLYLCQGAMAPPSTARAKPPHPVGTFEWAR